ncbi:MAG TPA: adenylate/guanylate cyclase domain-containing protein [Candidatus Polarisedimenticolaceae bacterium]|nr:adenylate/guanylate cyclase domain-containing protein [Candidatus Polarisedimenticolaceae bacterium]
MGVTLAHWPTAAGLERSALDLLFKLRGPRPAPDRVCVVAIDDPSYRELNLQAGAAVPRPVYAQLIRTLKAEGAAAVAFDILFDSETTLENDLDLEAALAEAGNDILGVSLMVTSDPRFQEMRWDEPIPPLAQAAAALGEVNFPYDPDGVIRSAWPMRADRPSLALAAYELATKDTSKREPWRLIDFYGGPRSIRTVSLYQALDPKGSLPPGFFRDKLVFVGASQEAVTTDKGKDSFPTPWTSAEAGTTYGVEIHATVAANLLDGRRIRLLPFWPETLLLLLMPLAASLAFMQLGPQRGGVVFLLSLPAPLLVGWLAFSWRGIWMPVTIPSVIQLPLAYGLSLLWYYLTTAKDRERIKRAFGHYLAPEMVAQLAENPDRVNLGGEEIVATAMFTDLAGFTSIAEKKTAPETVHMLNEYFSQATQHVFEFQGTLVKYIGDAVFAIWGAPLHRPDHATLACRAALALARSEATRGDGLKTRIGVHTGTMVVGNLGSAQRFDYTAIGDAVNLASRIEGLNKAFGTRVLASADALAHTGGAFLTRSLGRVRVVGRTEPVELHELLGLAEEGAIQEPSPACLEAFARGLELFAAGRFREAAEAFREALGHAGGKDAPSEAFWRFAEGYAVVPPEGTWDGTLVFESK